MEHVIIFQQGKSVGIMLPNTLCGLTVHQIGVKDVPEGLPFWIVKTSDLPTDFTQQFSWSLDTEILGAPSGHGGQNV